MSGALQTVSDGTETVPVGPAPAPLHMVRGRYRWRFLVKCDRDVDIQSFMRSWLAGVKTRGSLRLAVDIDPYSFM